MLTLRHRSSVLPFHTAGKNQCGKPQQLKYNHLLPYLSCKSQTPESNSYREICFLQPPGLPATHPLPFMARAQRGICSANQPTWPCWFHAWLLRARRCSVGVPSCHCPVRLNPKPPLSVPDTSLGSRPCAKACPSSLGSSLLPVHPTFQRLHHFSVPTSLSPASQHTSRHTSFQHDTSDTPAAMQALKSNAVQNCTRFPGDWECTGFEERHPLISPGSFSHGAHLTAALPYFVLQLRRIARRDLEEPLQNTKCSGVLVSLPK